MSTEDVRVNQNTEPETEEISEENLRIYRKPAEIRFLLKNGM